MSDPNEEYRSLCRAEIEAERRALDISTMIRQSMSFEDGAWIGVPTDEHDAAEIEAWRKVEELRKKRRDWVTRQKEGRDA